MPASSEHSGEGDSGGGVGCASVPMLILVPVETTLEARERSDQTSGVRSGSSMLGGGDMACGVCGRGMVARAWD